MSLSWGRSHAAAAESDANKGELQCIVCMRYATPLFVVSHQGSDWCEDPFGVNDVKFCFGIGITSKQECRHRLETFSLDTVGLHIV